MGQKQLKRNADRREYGQEIRNYSLKFNLTFKCFAPEKLGFDNEYGPYGTFQLKQFIGGKNCYDDAKAEVGIIAGEKEQLDSFILKVGFLGTIYWTVTSSNLGQLCMQIQLCFSLEKLFVFQKVGTVINFESSCNLISM